MEVHANDAVCGDGPLECPSTAGVDGPKDPRSAAMIDHGPGGEGRVRLTHHVVRPGAVTDGQRDANPDEVLTQGDDAPNVLGHAGRDASPIRIFEVGHTPEHAAVFEHVVEVQHLIGVQFQGHHLAFWTVGQHERDDHRLGRTQMDGVDVTAS